MKKISTWINGLSQGGKNLLLITVTLLTFGGISAAAQQPGTPNNSSSTTTQINTQKPSPSVTVSPKVEVKDETTTEVVPFTTSTINDSSLASGTTQVRTAGVNGVRTHHFKVTYSDSKETNRNEVDNSVTTAPVNEVIAKGTYVAPAAPSCPHGTYVNSAGNTVCSPYSTSSTPSGATAQCADGSYSFSQSRRGTCSHHGGVSTWL